MTSCKTDLCMHLLQNTAASSILHFNQQSSLAELFMTQTSPWLTKKPHSARPGRAASRRLWAVCLLSSLLNTTPMQLKAHAQYMLSSLIASSP